MAMGLIHLLYKHMSSYNVNSLWLKAMSQILKHVTKSVH